MYPCCTFKIHNYFRKITTCILNNVQHDFRKWLSFALLFAQQPFLFRPSLCLFLYLKLGGQARTIVVSSMYFSKNEKLFKNLTTC